MPLAGRALWSTSSILDHWRRETAEVFSTARKLLTGGACGWSKSILLSSDLARKGIFIHSECHSSQEAIYE